MSERCFVILHSPGPAWEPGLPLTQQLGVREHEAHYAELARQGLVVMGGPFADATGGGLMIFRAGLDEDTLRMHALTDPAVESGLLQFEILPWVIAYRG
ncbi:MAG TPA: hypothetical protein PKJ45_10505 [Rubrivivax sp.]|nr:hypothetical protein [Burkholderiales bacterium]HNU11772.1 hypothetical protein [Rubrivivax sp.]